MEYYKEATERMTLPDMVGEPAVPETTEAIREIDSVQCLSVLMDLLKLSYNVSFVTSFAKDLITGIFQSAQSLIDTMLGRDKEEEEEDKGEEEWLSGRW